MKTLFRKMLLKLHYIYFELNLVIRKPKYTSKVFCIGFSKTGTTSCGRALVILGYRHSTFNRKVWRKYYKNNEIVNILRYTAKFDSVDDYPWLKEDMIPILDRVFPNSQFIYLTRDEDSWKESMYNWKFKKTGKYPNLEEELGKFRKHREFVLSYFGDRPKDQFLILDVTDKEAFQKLAEFLDKKTSQKSFPHLNKANPSG